ncbi:MAG: DUF4388 domain-containing protein [Acidobacteria bacterium]|nr:DUF4388 domain-containing protein [Acidobacteriota bacterium]
MTPQSSPGEGFEGAIRGLGLSDVIQFNVQNRFTGCLAVQNGDLRGLLFFREGAIVHAEHGNQKGEEAFYDILNWPAGRFGLQPGLSTPHSTIQKSWQHLLLDATRVMDEQRAGRAKLTQEVPPMPQDSGSKPARPSDIIDRVKGVPGVLFTVLQTKDGTRVGDHSFEGEVLSGMATFLTMLAGQLATVFQAGELLSAVVQGSSQHLLLFASKNHHLCVLASASSQAGAVEAEIRRVLSWYR